MDYFIIRREWAGFELACLIPLGGGIHSGE